MVSRDSRESLLVLPVEPVAGIECNAAERRAGVRKVVVGHCSLRREVSGATVPGDGAFSPGGEGESLDVAMRIWREAKVETDFTLDRAQRNADSPGTCFRLSRSSLFGS